MSALGTGRAAKPLALAAVAAMLAAGACGGGGRDASPEPERPYSEIEFTAEDGEVRSGRLYGDGEVAVVLSHMGRGSDGQDDWAPFAESLADDGFRVVTYEGRTALSQSWNDVSGAVDYLRDVGAEKVVAGGASIGAMASLHAAARPESDINAVLWLAGVLHTSDYEFTESDVADLACPIMIASGEQDSYGAGEDAVRLHEWTAEHSELLIVDSDRHGTDMLLEGDAEVAAELRRTMTDFLGRVAERPAVAC